MEYQGYLIPSPRGNAIRRYGEKIIPAMCEHKKKYIYAGNSRFAAETRADDNKNPYHAEVSEYSGDWLLYDSLEAAEMYLNREAALYTVRQYDLNKLPYDKLARIVEILKE